MQSNFPCNCYPRQHAGNCASNELRYKARSIYQQVPLKQIIHFGGYVRPEEKEKADA
jgi:predicted nucleotidyltransferase